MSTPELILAEGAWCRNCDFFEDEMPESSCVACGCLPEQHEHVKVIKIEEPEPQEPESEKPVDGWFPTAEVCHSCGRRIYLKREGWFSDHTQNGSISGEMCPGSGERPEDQA